MSIRDVRRKNARTKSLLDEMDRIQPVLKNTTIPRWGSGFKPYACTLGMHKWTTDVHMNIPILKCSRCGAFRFKDIAEGTATKAEIKGVVKAPPPMPKDKKEFTDQLIKEWYRRVNYNPRK